MSAQNNSPNTNLFALEKVENGVQQVVRALNEIEPTNDGQLDLKNMCLEDLKDFQNGNLLALRRAIEND